MTVTYMGKNLWKVQVRKEQVASFYVLGESIEDVMDDAENLASGLGDEEYQDFDFEVDVHPANSQPSLGALVWSGGIDGEDVGL